MTGVAEGIAPTFLPLAGDVVSLAPLSGGHRSALKTAAQDPAIWQHTQHNGAEDFDAWWHHATTATEQFVYVVRDRDGAVLGSSRFYDIDWTERRLQIGYSWYVKQVWGTSINRACKELLLNHAFALGFVRVSFSLDAENARSRRAVEKLGATLDGILRSHKFRRNGSRRDTAVYSLLSDEWTGTAQR